MPVDPQPLPDEWRRPFRVGDARAAGIREGRLRRLDLIRSFHGTRAPVGSGSISAYVPLLRAGDRFSHTTAALMWDVPLPDLPGIDLHVTGLASRGRPRGAGVVGHEGDPRDAVLRYGVPVSAPGPLLRELAAMLSRDRLVAAADHLVLAPRVANPRDPRPHVDLAELRSQVHTLGGRGIRRAREAADLARPGVESAMESALRLLVRDAGLPEPVCGYRLDDGRGRWIGWFDLAWPAQRVLAEYDGDQHRTSTAQYEKDIARFDRAGEAGWQVVRVRAPGLRAGRLETASRLRAALHR